MVGDGGARIAHALLARGLASASRRGPGHRASLTRPSAALLTRSQSVQVELRSATDAPTVLRCILERGQDFNSINTSTCWFRLGHILSHASKEDWRDAINWEGDPIGRLLARTSTVMPTLHVWSLANTLDGIMRSKVYFSPRHRDAARALFEQSADLAADRLALEVDPSVLAEVTLAATAMSAALTTAGLGGALAVGMLSSFGLSGALQAAPHASPAEMIFFVPAGMTIVCASTAVIVSATLWDRSTRAQARAWAREQATRPRDADEDADDGDLGSPDSPPNALDPPLAPREASVNLLPLAAGSLVAASAVGAVGEYGALHLLPAVAGRLDSALFLTALPASFAAAGAALSLGVASELWRVASTGEAVPAWLSRSLAATGALQLGVRPLAVVTLASAFSRAGISSPRLYMAIASHLTKNHAALRELDAVNLASVAFSFARSKVPAPGLFGFVSARALPRVPNAPYHSLVKLVWAMARAGHRDDALLNAVSAELFHRTDDLRNPHRARDLVSLSWAMATLRAGAEGRPGAGAGDGAVNELPAFVVSALYSVLNSLRPSDVVVALWSLAVWRQFAHQRLWRRAWAIATDEKAVLRPQHHAMLFQIKLALECETEELASLHLRDDLRESGRSQLRAQLATPSAGQRQVLGVLRALCPPSHGFSVQHEHRLLDGAISVDAAVWLQSESDCRVAVEFDGPSHYIGTPPSAIPDGATALKCRLLQHLGWSVVSIPWWEWHELQSAPKALRLTYVHTKIAARAPAPFVEAIAQTA